MGTIVTSGGQVRENRIRYDTINGVRTGPFVDGNYYSFVRWRQVDQQKTAGFAKKKRDKTWLPENPYSCSTEQGGSPRAGSGRHLKVTWIPTGDFSEYYGPLNYEWNTVTYFSPTTAGYASLQAKLEAKLLSKVKGMKVHLGNFIAERDQMFDMFGKNATKIARAARNVKKGNFKKAFEDLGCRPSNRLSAKKSLANNWLELQYGWLPLLSDIYDASQVVEEEWNRLEPRPPLNRAVSIVRQTEKDLFHPAQPAHANVTREYIYTLRGIINYSVDVQASHFLGSIGLTNPLSIAWEVLPFSFVVDWAFPVGKMLENLDATLGCSFISGVEAGSLWSHLSYTYNETFVIGNYKYEYSNIRAHSRYFKYSRAPMSGFPSVQLPQPKNPFSSLHAANALALLTQVFKG